MVLFANTEMHQIYAVLRSGAENQIAKLLTFICRWHL